MLALNVNRMSIILPSGKLEIQLRAQGVQLIAGVDEAGAGALAGPVVAAAVILPEGHGLAVRDSKTLSQRQRETLFDQIHAVAIAVGVGIVHVEDINKLGIRPANLLAMQKAAEALTHVDHILVDAREIPHIKISQTAIIRGDQQEFCIAAASIIAKVTRDRFMTEVHQLFPQYNFAQHKGYGTLAHRMAVQTHGRCSLHRESFTIEV
ncbi:ribonuclease HII [Candidatus Uhrbacteria bacterium CG10_big_fil_rev_8_21_14_0_10_50_16]|uniref:Ribonuclease HII n=1 Tax=Candidatus Uhrbacteria bacterium CG10_big_fil_rev_8_21_14_0_10_50_16 TaxID=1975039 RepID=A0A2H0RLM2_9BACT|nr:MAG: ribonuclease HII [Candidatus Uhrbacteria bacterium CG10_big_fil_rev_8_21_14_0_10_50_16]